MIAVIVKFGEGFPLGEEGPSLLAFERQLREHTGLDCRVFKERMGDDSKLRVKMTLLERDKL